MIVVFKKDGKIHLIFFRFIKSENNYCVIVMFKTNKKNHLIFLRFIEVEIIMMFRINKRITY